MDTIAAISTPIGHGGIGIVRISGEKSIEIAKSIFKSKNDMYKPNTIVYGKIYDGEELVDDVLVSYFKAPNSYTGEDVIEINSHGGILIVDRILALVLENGARLATPGEFTKRAFLNGKIDLSRAEAVIDLINSKTKIENNTSAKQLSGEIGEKIKEIKKNIVDVLVDLEANVDYPEYDIEEISRNKVKTAISNSLNDLEMLSKSYDEGKIIKDGINIAIVGKPNVGKSSLLNRLLNEERAIVTEVAGTTRDTIEESIVYKGILLNIIDTAGIHKTADKVENIGVTKSLNVIENADLSLIVIDSSKALDNEDLEVLEETKNKKRFIVLNKTDIKFDQNLEDIKEDEIIKISAKENTGIDNLLDKIIEEFKVNEIEKKNDIIITNKRHKEAIDNTIKSLENVLKSTDNGTPLDMISIDLQNSISNLDEILGENVSEDIINGIFAKFCLGK